jgi:hypothetical protein
MDAIRSLFRLELKHQEIQEYLQLDRDTFIAALNRIHVNHVETVCSEAYAAL